jgi:hypothetical protein
VEENAPPVVLDWLKFAKIVEDISGRILADGTPDVIVGILRGGLVPAVMIAHAIGVRAVRAIEITHTMSDGENASFSPQPSVTNASSIGDLADLDVLIIDDVVGTTHTISVAENIVLSAGAARVRTLACCEVSGYERLEGGRALDYVGVAYSAWVILPWER